MATPLLGLALPVQGSNSGSWGNLVNNSITSLIDSAIAGTTTLSADSDVTLTTTEENVNQAREAIILWTASGTVTRYVTAPYRSKTYVVINASSTQSIVVRAYNSGTSTYTTGVTVDAGEKCVVAWNGSDFVKASSSATQVKICVTPEQFGAIGDGTTNDRVALQAALDSGFDVFLSLGKTYLFSGSSLKITTSNQIVGGPGILKPSGAIQGVVIGAEATTAAGSFVVGKTYVITTVGSTNFTLIGASSNAVGTTFVATGVGSGSGAAWLTTFGNEVSLTFSSAVQTSGYYALYIGNANRVKVSKLHIYDAGGGLYVTSANTVSVEWMWAAGSGTGGGLRGPGIKWYGNDSQRSDVLNIVFALLAPGAGYYGMDWDGNCNSLTAKYLGIVGGASGGKGMIIRNTSGSTTTFPAIGRFGQIEVDYPASHGIEITSGLDYDFEMPYVLGAGTWPTFPVASQDGIRIGASINDYEVRISGGKFVGNTGYGINALGGIIYLAGNTSLYTNTSGPYNSNNNIINRVPRYSVDNDYYLALSGNNPLLTFNPNSYISYDRGSKALNVQVANSAGSASIPVMTFTNSYVNSLLPMYLGNNGGTGGQLRMYGATSGYLQFAVPSTVTASIAQYTWPAGNPTAGYYLQTDVSGNLSWAAGGGGGGVTSVSGTGTVSGLTLSGTVTSTGSLTLGGAISGTGSGSVVLATSPTITTPVISGNTTVNGLSLGVGPGTVNVQNTVFGKDAFIAATTGVGNTMIGAYTGGAITTRGNNTAVGYAALVSATADANTAIGALSLSNVSPGAGYAFNTAVGYNALGALATYSNCSGLGSSTDVTGNNQVQLGSSTTTTYYYAIAARSDLRDKADVRDTQLGLGFINALRPVDYKWDMRDDYKPARPEDTTDKAAMAAWVEACNLSNITHDGSKKRSRYHHGLIAQEVKAVLDAQGIDFGGYQDHKVKDGQDVLTIGYDELIAPLIKAIQELTARVQELEAKA